MLLLFENFLAALYIPEIMRKGSQPAVDLPREELIGWISKQLSLGIRSRPNESSPDTSVVSTVTRTFELKKEILKNSKNISNFINNKFAEQWRKVELENQLLFAQWKHERLLEAARAQADHILWHNGTVTVYVNVLQEPHIHTLSDFQSSLDRKWSEIETKFSADISARTSEDQMIQSDLASTRSTVKLVHDKQQISLDQCLHERFLLKQLKQNRELKESELRKLITSLSAKLHHLRDRTRIRESKLTEQKAHVQEMTESEKREIEWQLMEDEIRLTRELRQVHEAAKIRCEKLHLRISNLNLNAAAERAFIDEQSKMIGVFREEIARIRIAVRDMENTVSRFKSYLRHSEKSKRVGHKIVHE
jgi:hypothetical protein